MDQYFVKLLLDQLKKGNKICNPFKKQAWNDTYQKKRKRNKHGMICSCCSMENLALNMKRVTVCLLGYWYSFLLYFHAYNC